MQNITQTSLLLLSLSLSHLVHAAESSENSKTADAELSLITVTATRTTKETNLVSSTVIKRADIERLQVNSVEEALRGIAGINITNSGGLGKQTSVFMRGTNADHVLVLIDGVRIGSVTLGTSAFENIPINEIDSIEVVRGAKSSLYGADAIGGVIHIHTRSGANKKAKPVLSISAGSHNHFRYSGGVSGTVENTWYSLNLTQERTQGFGTTDSLPATDHEGWNNHAGSFRIGHNFSDRWLVEFNALYSTGKNLYQIPGLPAWGIPSVPFASNTYTDEVFGGQVKYKATDFWTITVKSGLSRDLSHDQYYNSAFDSSRVSMSAQNDFKIAENHLLSVGYDFLSDDIKTNAAFATNSRTNQAGFAQYQGEYDGHQLNLGIRLDHNSQFGDHTTWNAAYGYNFLEVFNVIASYSTAFKAPAFNQLYYPNFGNPNLAPERAKNYEVGINGKHDWGKWTVNFYENDIKNLIIFDPNHNYLPYNIGVARIKGMDATIGTQWYGFTIQGNLTLLNPRDNGNPATDSNTGNVLPRRAQSIFRLDVDRRFDTFSTGASLRAEGRRWDDPANTQRVGGFATLDLRAEYTLLKQLTLQAKVNNILNKHYQTVSGYNADALNFFFTLRYAPDI